MTPRWLISVGLCTVGAAAFALLSLNARPSASRARGVASSRSSHSESQAEVSVRHVIEPARPGAASAARTARTPAPAATRDIPPPRAHEILEQRFVGETADRAWSVTAEIEMSDALTRVPGSRLLEVHCKTSLCRVSVQHEDESAEEAFLTRVPHLQAFGTQGVIHHVETQDGPRSVVYVARPGYTNG